MRIIAIGNCQSQTFANLASRMVPEHEFTHLELHSLDQDVSDLIASNDLALLQPHIYDRLPAAKLGENVIRFPRCSFSGLHPDMIYVLHDGKKHISPASHHSAIVFGGYLHGLTQYETEALFHDPQTFDMLQFSQYFEGTRKALFSEWELCGLDIKPHFETWMSATEPFMLTMNHPKLHVVAAAAEAVLTRLGFAPLSSYDPPHHHLEDLAIMPVYPFIAERHGMNGSLEFIRNNDGRQPRSIDLYNFIRICFANYEKCDKDKFSVTKATNALYQAFFADVIAKRRRPAARHPYRDIPAHQNWRKSVAEVSAPEVDPVVDFKFKISPTDKVATAGSCFAQHLARALVRSGLNYFAPEQGDPALGYGLYSARYGNVYTTLQLSQLLDRAYERFTPGDTAWQKTDGTYADPFRPEIPLERNSTVAEIEAERAKHFAYVREMVEGMDYFVFTLGLTECWVSKTDGAVFPIAPGVAAGEMDFDRYAFANLDEADTYQHLKGSIAKIRAINPSVKVILTVSPVPLMATFEPRHVLSSTTYSKAVLRVAAEKACREIENVAYFPSFEIITGNYNRGSYFDEDLRSVRQEGVDHVMRLFLKHATTAEAAESEIEKQIREDNEILCAEEMLDA